MMRRFRQYPQIGGRDDRVYDTEVDYILSTGTQYIELPYRLGPNVKFEFKANWVSPSVGAYSVRRWGQNSSSWECFIDASGGYFANSNLGSAHINQLGVDYTYIFDLTSGALKLSQNGVVLKSSTGTYPVKNPIEIFGIRGAAQGRLDTFAVCKLYYYKLWVDGELVVDAIPVRKGSKGFLFDRISGEPLETQGGGDFIVGPDKKPGHIWTWTDGKTLNSIGSYSENNLFSVLDQYLPTEYGHSITFAWGNTVVYGNTNCLIEYDVNKNMSPSGYWSYNQSSGVRKISVYSTVTKFVRFSAVTSQKDYSFVRDDTTKKYLYRGSNVPLEEGYADYDWSEF